MNDIIKKIGTKNLIKIGIGLLIFITIVVASSLIYHQFFFKRSFSEIEDIMKQSAIDYYSKHPKKLPTNEGETINIKASELVNAGYMKTMNEYLKDDNILCKGSINVTKMNNKYRYTPLLDCGNDYKYEFFTDHIKNNTNIVTTDAGLYQVGDDLVYRGEFVNNYVSFAKANWRIIKITNNKVMLIYEGKLGENVYFDDRYNSEKDFNNGINDYTRSRIREKLNDIYKDNSLFTNKNKLLLSSFDLYIGKVKDTDNDLNASLAKSTTLSGEHIGLLSVSDYMNASIDSNCTSVGNHSCNNYNYLYNTDYNYWTLTGSSTKSYYAYKVIAGSGLEESTTASKGYIRPVIMITSDAIYKNGNGTENKPYKFK